MSPLREATLAQDAPHFEEEDTERENRGLKNQGKQDAAKTPADVVVLGLENCVMKGDFPLARTFLRHEGQARRQSFRSKESIFDGGNEAHA